MPAQDEVLKAMTAVAGSAYTLHPAPIIQNSGDDPPSDGSGETSGDPPPGPNSGETSGDPPPGGAGTGDGESSSNA